MALTRNLIAEYEYTLKNNFIENEISSHFFQGNNAYKEKQVTVLVRYLIENILHYTPVEALNYLNLNVLDHFHLTEVLRLYFSFPSGMNEKEKIHYLIHKAYPNEIHFSTRQWVRNMYQQKMKKYLNKEKKNVSFPKEFFANGIEGIIYSCICLDCALTINCPKNINNLEDLYEYFYRHGEEYLKKNCLWKACVAAHDGDALLYLHYTLNKEQRDEFLYSYYIFRKQYNALFPEDIKKKRKRKTVKNEVINKNNEP